MAKTARRWSSLDRAAVKILANMKKEDPRDLSYRQMAKLTGMTPSRLSGLFLETMGPPTLDEFCTLCELFDQPAPKTLQLVITESQKETATHDDSALALDDERAREAERRAASGEYGLAAYDDGGKWRNDDGYE